MLASETQSLRNKTLKGKHKKIRRGKVRKILESTKTDVLKFRKNDGAQSKVGKITGTNKADNGYLSDFKRNEITEQDVLERNIFKRTSETERCSRME